MNSLPKIAILCSGLAQNHFPFEENILSWKAALPEADVFKTTWKIRNQLNNKFEFNKYYDDFSPHYNCGLILQKDALKRLRKAKKNNEAYSHHDLEFIKSYWRQKNKQNVKQFVSHIYMYDDFVKNKNYDLVLRVRPETYINPNEITSFRELCKLAYDEKTIIGFETIDIEYKIHEFGWNFLSTANNVINDWAIIYYAKYFDPDIAMNNYYNKKIRAAELGWFDTLIRSQKFQENITPRINWNGVATLRSSPVFIKTNTLFTSRRGTIL